MIEFESYFNKWGIKLTETKVPKKMDNHKHRGALYFINEQQFLLVIPSVLGFWFLLMKFGLKDLKNVQI